MSYSYVNESWGQVMPLIEVEDFRLLLNFRLSGDGDFLLESVGEHLVEPFWEKMYPALYDAQEKDTKAIRRAVIKERHRVHEAPAPSPDTELGKDLQRAMGLPVSLANKEVTRRAKEVLREAKPKGKPQ